jgi:hypothetical protein
MKNFIEVGRNNLLIESNEMPRKAKKKLNKHNDTMNVEIDLKIVLKGIFLY